MYQGKFLKTQAPEKPPVPETEDTPNVPEQAPEKTPKKKKRGPSTGTIVFYSIYGVFVAAAIFAIMWMLVPLKDWLVRYEESQPERKCQAVYDTFFAEPDWGILYELANVEDTAFEGKEAYISYMTQKHSAAKDPILECVETSAGLSGDHKYIIKLDGEKIATFTLTEGESVEEGITVWDLGVIEVFFTRQQSVTVQKLPEHTVYINGVALDESYVIRSVSTKAESYLPDGLHGYRMEQVQIGGLLVAPEVKVLDQGGKPVTMYTDVSTGMLKPELPAPVEITEEETNIVIEAAKAYSRFAIRSITSTQLRKYMDSSSQLYADVVATPAFMQSYTGYDFQEGIQVTDYCRYSDTLFSARVQMKMNVYASRGNTKVFEMDTTFFFTKNSAGSYLITSSTNVDITEQIEQIRLTFMNGAEQVDSFMIDSSSHSVTLPAVTAPQGKVLKGWAIQEADDKGNINMTILFIPGENGTAPMPQDEVPGPMTLYAVFEIEGK